jgi:DNA adenine methylase
VRYYTPMRYPGGKANLSRYMRQIFIDNGLLDGIYVEPYAGGAGIALELLMTDYAREVWLNDIDPAVHALWFAVLHHTGQLLDLIKTTPLTINEWRKQREVYLQPGELDIVTRGFSTLFLNRTNRSGILNGGVIGGLRQKGPWGIHARFNRDALVERVRRIGHYAHRIRLFNEDAEHFLGHVSLPNRSLVYLDPPYFRKGQRLYRNHYLPEDHKRIAEFVQRDLNCRWVVSYDDTYEIEELYRKRRRIRYALKYSAQSKRSGDELMIFCDDLRLRHKSSPAQC